MRSANELVMPMLPDAASLAQDLESDSDEKEFGDSTLASLDFTPQAQFDRDVALIANAIERPGENLFSSRILEKIFTLFYFGDLRCVRDKQWQPWNLPLASAIVHGSRVTIQFPDDLSEEILAWLFEGENPDNHGRLAATHGLEEDPSSTHSIRESKLYAAQAGAQAGRKVAASLLSWIPGASLFGIDTAVAARKRHFGINLALGGVGATNPISGNLIENNGEHGHLYLCYRPTIKQSKFGGLLIGIEQSAPGCADQNGGSHGIMATHHKFSATGGLDFGKSANVLGQYGPDRYYNSIFVSLDAAMLQKIRQAPFEMAMLSSFGDPEVRNRLPYLDLQIEPAVRVKKLASNELFDFAFMKLMGIWADQNAEEKSFEIIEPMMDTVYGARFVANDTTVILTSAASDALSVVEGNNTGTTPLAQVLEKIRALEQQNPKAVYLVPLAECQSIFKGIVRQHWTLLMIQNQQCYFLDPCANAWWPSAVSLSAVYSLQPLKGILKENGFTWEKYNWHSYLGWQTDDVNCGRFVGAIAAASAQMLFEGASCKSVQTRLEQLAAYPKADELVREQSTCRIPAEIRTNRSICDERRQEVQELEAEEAREFSMGRQ